MGRGLRSALCRSVLALLSVVVVAIPPAFSAQAKPPKTVSAQPGSAQPIDITAEHIEYLQGTDVYEAEGSVVIVQGPLRLTADRVTIMMLSGTLIATGHVHLSDPKSDMRSERLELDVNTEAGVVTNGELNIKFTDTLVTGRLFQRFSEDHYRVKDGSFTNCDVKEGVPPAWRFTFKDLDLNMGESVYAKDLWLCVNDIPVLPLPTLTYPVQTNRRSGFLVPTAGYNTVFGTTYTQGYFWAINPSRDMTVTPNIMTNRGYGSDIDYRYILNRKTRGQWLLTFLQDTTEDRKRALLTGTHVQQVNPDLSIRVQAFLVTDRSYLNNLSNSGTQRALPSGDSTLYINQRFANGNLYLLGQFLQREEATPGDGTVGVAGQVLPGAEEHPGERPGEQPALLVVAPGRVVRRRGHARMKVSTSCRPAEVRVGQVSAPAVRGGGAIKALESCDRAWWYPAPKAAPPARRSSCRTGGMR